MIWAIVLVSAVAFGARMLPFLLADRLSRSKLIRNLGQKLPPAIMILLVAYTLAERPFLAYPYGVPEIAGIAVVIGVHLWRRSMMLSIVAGVGTYQLLLHTM